MFSFDRFARVAFAMVGALVLTTVSITAAASPAQLARDDVAQARIQA